jgi:hypothetical protein
MEILKGKYRHFKGGLYEVIEVALDCENPERRVVVYRALYDEGKIWFRDLEDFNGWKIFSDGRRVKRFEFVEG